MGTPQDAVRSQGAHQTLQAPFSTSQLASVRHSLVPVVQLLQLGLNFPPPGPTSTPSLKVWQIPSLMSSLPSYSTPPLILQSSPLPNYMETKSLMNFATCHGHGSTLFTARDIVLWASGSTFDVTFLPDRQYFSPPSSPISLNHLSHNKFIYVC